MRLIIAVALLAALGCAQACTTVNVGVGASDDGSLYLCRTVDESYSNISNNLFFHPPRNTSITFHSTFSNFTTTLPEPGQWYIALPDFRSQVPGANASLEENGFNAAGVAMSATETIYSNNATLAADPLNPNGIIEDVIASIILPHPEATSAKASAKLLGGFIERYGSGEGFGVSFSDTAGDMWYLENAGGHLWLAQRVPPTAVFVSANQGRFQEVDFEDTDNVMSSPGLVEFAVSKGLYDDASGKPFNWLTAFIKDEEDDTTYNYPRVAWLTDQFAHEAPTNKSMEELMSRGPYFPVFQYPAKPVTLLQLMRAMRWHYDYTAHDPYFHQNPKEPWRPIAVLRTSIGHITRTRTEPGLPDGLTIINYVSTTMPHLAPFIPIYRGLPGDALPAALTAANGTAPDGVSLFWKARRLQALVFQDWPGLGPQAAETITDWEADVVERQQPEMERRYIRLWGKGQEDRAAQLLVAFTQDVVAQAGQLLEELAVQAAQALGRNGVPPDDVLEPMLWNATTTYKFHGA